MDNTQLNERTQVQELLMKVEEVVEQNQGWFLEVDSSWGLLHKHRTGNNLMWNEVVVGERRAMESWNLQDFTPPRGWEGYPLMSFIKQFSRS